jgi:hypothetical protein
VPVVYYTEGEPSRGEQFLSHRRQTPVNHANISKVEELIVGNGRVSVREHVPVSVSTFAFGK